MQITPNEIDIVEDAGLLNKNPVKFIRTKGGLWIAVARLKGKFQDEAIATGSHPAIVKYNIGKQYPDFQPIMMKSENFSDNAIVDKHSHFLSDALRKSGHDIYSIQNGPEICFQITRHNINLASINTRLQDNAIVIKNLTDLPQKFTSALAGATCEKAYSCKASKIKVEKK
jgi:hypothetical protein